MKRNWEGMEREVDIEREREIVGEGDVERGGD